MKNRVAGSAFSLLFLAAVALAQEIELPFEIEPSQAAILVHAAVDGRPVLLILDTGASRTILERELVRLPAQGLSRFSSEGPGLKAAGRYTEANLELGGRLWRNRSVVGMNLAEVSKAYGRRIDGLLGQDLLCEFDRITIDYRAKRIVLANGETSASR